MSDSEAGSSSSVLEQPQTTRTIDVSKEEVFNEKGFAQFLLMGIGSMPRANRNRWIEYLPEYGCEVEGSVQKFIHENPEFSDSLPSSDLQQMFVLSDNLISPNQVTSDRMNSFAADEQLVVPNHALMCGFASRMTDEYMKKMGFDRVLLLHKPVKLRKSPGSEPISYILALHAGLARRREPRKLLFVPCMDEFGKDPRRGFLYIPQP